MTTYTSAKTISFFTVFCAASLLLAGCAGTDNSTASSDSPKKGEARYRLTDGRIVKIGPVKEADGGMTHRNSWLEMNWLAPGFDFNGYDTLHLAPVTSTAKFNDD